MAKKPTERPEQVPYPASSRLPDLLATLQPAAKPERPRPARQPKPVPKYYRTLTKIDVKRLVHARFNSLTDCSTVHMSYPAIAKRHRLPVSTCCYAVRAYLQRGLTFVNRWLPTVVQRTPSRSRISSRDSCSRSQHYRSEAA